MENMVKSEKIQPSYNTDRVKLGKVLPIDTPFTIMADISDVCNFKCNYCFRGMGKKEYFYGNDKFMTEETFHQIIAQALEFDGRIKRFSLSHQGEPLAHPKFAEFAAFAKEQDVADSVEIHTNASLLNLELCRKIAECNLDRIIISLQGMDAEKYKEICGFSIDYETFFENIKYLYQIKKETLLCIKIIDTALTKEQENLFYEKYAPVADRIYIETEVPLWDGNKTDVIPGTKKTNNKYGRENMWQQTCPLVFYTLNVLPDGTVFPCTNIRPPFILGNVHLIHLKECWESAKRRDFLTAQLKNARGNCQICQNCYIPQNTIMTQEDVIDGFEEDILKRMERKTYDSRRTTDCMCGKRKL